MPSRIMGHYGFHILAMWTNQTDDRQRFVYLLSWQSEEEMRERWSAFMADEEWSQIKVKSRVENGGEPVLSIEDIVLQPFLNFHGS